MTASDRRTFLSNGLRASATLAVAGVLPESSERGVVPARSAAARKAAARKVAAATDASAAHLSVTHPTVNGLSSPVGIDPDDCSFAWHLRSPTRSAAQRAYRITVRRSDPGHGAEVWDSGAVTSARQAFILYGGSQLAGDASYKWSVQAQDGVGQWSPAVRSQFVTMPRPIDWRATWLHPAATSLQPNQVTYLRTVFNPPSGHLVRATAFVAAAHTYQLWLDGQQVAFGPSFCFPDEQYVQSIDVTRYLQGGRRTAVGVLHHWYGAGKGRPASAPGLLLQVTLVYADGRRVTFGSDGSWKEQTAEWLPSALRNTDAGDYIEHIDGRAHPSGWATTSYDDAGWHVTAVRGPVGTAPFTHLFGQRTHIDEKVVAPTKVRTLANGSVVIDLGSTYAARPQVTFHHGVAGRTVPMHVGYELDPDGQVSTTHGTQQTDLSFSYIQRSGEQSFAALTYLGFRYLQVDAPGEPIGADQVTAVARHAAMPDVPAASFTTSDRMLNAVWKLNMHSCLYVSQEQFVDTPTREKGPFLWDNANESEAVMSAFGEQNLSWQGLRDVARGQARYWPDGRVNAIYPNGYGLEQYPIFTERYLEWIWRYYLATGDRDTAVLLYPTCARIGTYLWGGLNAATGLFQGYNEASNSDPFYGYDTTVSEDTTSNVLGVNAYRRLARLAALAGDTAGAASATARSEALTGAINARLVRSDGVYIDGLLPSGAQSVHASQEANAVALAYDVVPAARRRAVANYVASLGISVGPVHGLELLRGLVAGGLGSDAVETLTDGATPGWAHIVSLGGTFTWETWTPSDLIGDSKSHGWGSSALVAMKEIVLGLSPQAPDNDGTTVLSITPPPGNLTHVAGSVPTVAGPVSVEWRRRPRLLQLSTVVPPNARATITLPASSVAQVGEGGVPVHQAQGVTVHSSGTGAVQLSVGSGGYTFTVGTT
jgi:alpha-L-rhamnosidase